MRQDKIRYEVYVVLLWTLGTALFVADYMLFPAFHNKWVVFAIVLYVCITVFKAHRLKKLIKEGK